MPSYAYFWGCYVLGRLPQIERATRTVFDALGLEAAEAEGLTCCPEKTMMRNHSHRAWLLTAARNLAVAEAEGRTFVTPCTGCFGTLRGAATELRAHPELLAEVNRELARVGRSYRGEAEAVHVVEVLHRDVGVGALREQVKYPMTGMKIAVHYGCHLVRPSRELLMDDPFHPVKLDQLVEATGALSLPYTSKMDCCGNLLLRAEQEEAAQAMCRNKLRDVTAEGADAMVVVCPSCMMQYDHMQVLLQRGGEQLHVPVLYITQLLGLALGLDPGAVGLDRNRVEVTPFLEKWEARRRGIDEVGRHWDFALLRACAECGACVNDCAIAQADPSFDPNALIQQLAGGDVEGVLHSPNLWKCVECYTCAEYCPNKYDQMTILRIAKHLALERGLAPRPITEGLRTFHENARLTEASAAQRKRLGLPPVPAAPAGELRRLLAGLPETSPEEENQE